MELKHKGSKKACKGQALRPFLLERPPHPPHLSEGQGTMHSKIAPHHHLHPCSLSLLLPLWPPDIELTSCILPTLYQYLNNCTSSWQKQHPDEGRGLTGRGGFALALLHINLMSCLHVLLLTERWWSTWCSTSSPSSLVTGSRCTMARRTSTQC